MRRLVLLAALVAVVSCSGEKDILLEAEFFDTSGGWLLDEQFSEQVGSAYLLAHGAGTPVADASTTVGLSKGKRYYVWARTFNWNALWDSSRAPGQFQVLADGEPLPNILGTEGACWDWNPAGSFVAAGNRVTISLHDLTGFEGRCDALLVSRSENPVFPSERNIPLVSCPEKYDFIVVGAGTAGLSAGIAASRKGMKTLIIDDKPRVGGNSGPDIHVIISGKIHEGPYPALGNVIAEYGCAFSNYQEFETKLKAEENLTVLSLHRVTEVEMDGDAIRSVIAIDYAGKRKVRYEAPLFADCTGDANLGVLAGARWMMGAETQEVFSESLAPADSIALSMGSSVRWNSVITDSVSVFPHLDWAVSFNDTSCRDVSKGSWNWEAGFSQNQIDDAETIRDYMFRVIYGNWSYQKNAPAFKEKYAYHALTPESVSLFLGKRESRRLVGDYIINQNDCYGDWIRHPDAAVWSTYPIDQHFPTEEMTRLFPGGEFESTMKHNDMPLGVQRKDLVAGRDYNNPFMIPYRCLYSVNVPNMFMAGRNISGSRIAMCSYRVMATTSLMGEVVGLAASLCNELECRPRDIYTTHLEQFRQVLSSGVPSRYPEIFSPK